LITLKQVGIAIVFLIKVKLSLLE